MSTFAPQMQNMGRVRRVKPMQAHWIETVCMILMSAVMAGSLIIILFPNILILR